MPDSLVIIVHLKISLKFRDGQKNRGIPYLFEILKCTLVSM